MGRKSPELNPGARRYRAVVRFADLHDNGETWFEDGVDVTGDPEVHFRRVVEEFNVSLREGELPREVVEVRLDEGEGYLRHAWRKTNLVTVYERGIHFDRYVCDHCGVTGKRIQLDAIVADKFGGCPGPRLPTGSTRRIGRKPVETAVSSTYVDERGRTLFVGSGIGAEPEFMTFYRRPTGSKRRFVSPRLPPRETVREAQSDLDRLAVEKRWRRT
jgi:hypothetical protein